VRCRRFGRGADHQGRQTGSVDLGRLSQDNILNNYQSGNTQQYDAEDNPYRA
jgi:hypothetical protein